MWWVWGEVSLAMLRLAVTPNVVSLGRSESGHAKIICALSVVSLGRSESGYAKVSSDSQCGELFGEK